MSAPEVIEYAGAIVDRTIAAESTIAPEYGSPEWVADRKNYIGASDVPLLLDVSPYGGPLDLYLLKRGEMHVEESHAMKRGHIYEAATIEEFGLLFPELRFLAAYTRGHAAGDFLRATPDRLIVLPNGEHAIAEVKQVTPRLRDLYGESGSDDAPLYNLAQCQTQMEVCDINLTYLIVNFGYELRHFVIHRDRELGAFIVEEARKFMELVRNGTPPEPRPADTYEAITRRFTNPNDQKVAADEAALTLIEEFADVKAAKKAAEEREDELKSLLAARIGSAYGIDAGKAGYVIWPEQAGKTTKDFDGLVRELNVPDDVVQKFLRVGAPFRTMRYYPAKKRP